MKLNNIKNLNFKNVKKEFDPNSHWYKLVLIVFVLFLLIVAYSVYNFFYIKNEINVLEGEARDNIMNSTSSDYLEKTKKNNQLTKDINNLKKNLDKYEQKEREYERLLYTTNFIATTTATTTVATTTKE